MINGDAEEKNWKLIKNDEPFSRGFTFIGWKIPFTQFPMFLRKIVYLWSTEKDEKKISFWRNEDEWESENLAFCGRKLHEAKRSIYSRAKWKNPRQAVIHHSWP